MRIGNLPAVPQNITDELKNRGATIPDSVMHTMEQNFATDLSDVKVFVSHLPTLAGKESFAEGSDIHFAPGRYDPYSEKGLELLGHELAHVVQQRGGRELEQAAAVSSEVADIAREAANLGDGSV
jgi:hypothetical protein